MLAESFVRKYEDTPVGTNIVIDDTAIEFQVERRRFYDIIAILESLEFITGRRKNTYTGMVDSESISCWGGFRPKPLPHGQMWQSERASWTLTLPWRRQPTTELVNTRT